MDLLTKVIICDLFCMIFQFIFQRYIKKLFYSKLHKYEHYKKLLETNIYRYKQSESTFVQLSQAQRKLMVVDKKLEQITSSSSYRTSKLMELVITYICRYGMLVYAYFFLSKVEIEIPFINDEGSLLITPYIFLIPFSYWKEYLGEKILSYL